MTNLKFIIVILKEKFIKIKLLKNREGVRGE